MARVGEVFFVAKEKKGKPPTSTVGRKKNAGARLGGLLNEDIELPGVSLLFSRQRRWSVYIQHGAGGWQGKYNATSRRAEAHGADNNETQKRGGGVARCSPRQTPIFSQEGGERGE